MKTEAEKLQIAIAALKECEIPTGAYSMDRLTHAENTIQNIKEIVAQALKEIEEP
jgi:hypothetical protein